MAESRTGEETATAVADERRLGERIRASIQTRGFLILTIAVIILALYAGGLLAGTSAQRLLWLTVWGLALGGIVALGSIGLTLVYGVMNFPNFSHGALVSLGAYVTMSIMAFFPEGSILWPMSFGYEYIVAMIIAMPIVGVVSLAIDRVVYRRLRRTGAHLVLFAMASLAMLFLVQSMVYLGWGPAFHNYYPGRPNPALYLPFGVRVRGDQLFILGLGLVFMFGIAALLEWTRMGKAMRATSDNPDLARVRGINTERVIAWTWILGGGLAAAGGAMYGLSAQLRPEMGFWLLLPMFAAVIMGGIGNAYGAMVAALIIGVAHQVSSSFINPTYGPGIAFILMVVTLLIRPQGLFGRSGG